MYMLSNEQARTIISDACSTNGNSDQAILIVYTDDPSKITTIHAVEMIGNHEVMTTQYAAPSQVIPDGQGREIYASVFTLPPGNYAVFEPAYRVHDNNMPYRLKRTTTYTNYVTEADYFVKPPSTAR